MNEAFKAAFPHASADAIKRNPKWGLNTERAKAEVQRVLAGPKSTPVRKSTEERLNKTEKQYLARLREKYDNVGIQNIQLKVGEDCRYLGDFTTWDRAGKLTIYEVKGPYVYDRALHKPKACATIYPHIRFIVAQKDEQGNWTEKQIL